MRHSSDELFHLIKSLSKSEKGYFKKSAFTHITGQQNDYIKLFDFIDGQNIYDEAAVKRKFANESFIKRLAPLKHYLQETIVESLQAYHTDMSVFATMQKLLRSIEIFFLKNLYRHCLQTIKKAKKIAYRHDLFPELLNVLHWENLLYHTTSGALHKISSEEISKEEQYVVQLLNWHYSIKKVSSSLYRYYVSKGTTRNENDLKELAKEVKALELQFRKAQLPFRLQSYYLYTIAYYYYHKNEFNKSYTLYEKIVELFEAQPADILLSRAKDYTVLLSRFISNGLVLKKHTEVLKTIGKLRTLEANTTDVNSMDIQLTAFIHSYTEELIFYLLNGEITKASNVIDSIKQKLELFGDKVNLMTRFTFNYYIAYFNVITGKNKHALNYLNEIMNSSATDVREDIQSFAKILNLVIHFELGNEDLLESSIKSTYRFLYKKNRLYRIETAIVDFIRKDAIKIKNNKDLIEKFKKLKDKTGKLIHDPYEHRAIEYFDINSWLESKIEKCSFADAISKKKSV